MSHVFSVFAYVSTRGEDNGLHNVFCNQSRNTLITCPPLLLDLTCDRGLSNSVCSQTSLISSS